jgi:hypothetical protein
LVISGNADVFAVITPTEIDGSDLRLSGGTTPRRLAADEDEESPRSNRFTAKGPAAAAAAENKTKAARMSRSPPRRRKQDNAISKDKGSRKSAMTRSPTKKDKEVAYRYDDRSHAILGFLSSRCASSFTHTCCVCRAVCLNVCVRYNLRAP